VAPPCGKAATSLSVHMSPVCLTPLRTEKTADFGIESRDPTANLCPSSKIPNFLRGGGDLKRAIFAIFGVGVLSVGYSLHRTPDLHAKSMDY